MTCAVSYRVLLVQMCISTDKWLSNYLAVMTETGDDESDKLFLKMKERGW